MWRWILSFTPWARDEKKQDLVYTESADEASPKVKQLKRQAVDLNAARESTSRGFFSIRKERKG